jgi:hypothetical protein
MERELAGSVRHAFSVEGAAEMRDGLGRVLDGVEDVVVADAKAPVRLLRSGRAPREPRPRGRAQTSRAVSISSPESSGIACSLRRHVAISACPASLRNTVLMALTRST